MENLEKLLDKANVGFSIDDVRVNNLFYADDILLIANTKEELERLLNITEEYGLKNEIKFNPDKTNYILCFFQLYIFMFFNFKTKFFYYTSTVKLF